MPRCEVRLSEPFLARIENLKSECPQVLNDLKPAFERIEQHPERACGADALKGYGRTVYKYQCKSSDRSKGARDGFRIIGFLDKDGNPWVLYPILVYLKDQQTDTSDKEIAAALEALRASK